ncbi:MAG: hypothetical protein COV50_06690 [Flavobacteriales bacterium CG11_big_fil_rev_8_21_14_0_20_35_7]|nr:MAG: hypothetical protein COV50_06690 [Flavobacteriales bacterium CG11_big_fil_rev_8_21_14_0_20_35_7]
MLVFKTILRVFFFKKLACVLKKLACVLKKLTCLFKKLGYFFKLLKLSLFYKTVNFILRTILSSY